MPYTCIIVIVTLLHTYPLTFALTMVADHRTVNVCNIPLQLIKYENPGTYFIIIKVVIGKDVPLLELAVNI